MHSSRLVLFILLLIWISGIFVNLIIPDSVVFNPVISSFYSNVCHQNHLKSFQFSGMYLPVCARCTGIYIGAFAFSIISLFYLFNTNSLKLLFISSIPLIIDVIFYNIGIYSYNPIISFLTGLFFGSVVFIYILNSLELFFKEKKLLRYE